MFPIVTNVNRKVENKVKSPKSGLTLNIIQKADVPYLSLEL